MSPVEALQLDLERTERVLRDERARADRAVEDRRLLEARVKALREGLQEIRDAAILTRNESSRFVLAGMVTALIARDTTHE
jgi:hypothetical protein